MHNERYIVILCPPLWFACLTDVGLHTLTAYFDHHGSVGRQLTATLAHHHSTICYKYAVILYVIYVQWMLEINCIVFYSILPVVSNMAAVQRQLDNICMCAHMCILCACMARVH